MRRNNRWGATLCCDVLKRIETDEEILDLEQCESKFNTNSVSSLVRAQAAEAKWIRTKVKFVRWPGMPPMADGKKVDICPKHAKLVMTEDEYKAKKKAEREKAKAEKKAARAAAKAAAPKKPRTKKPKAEPESAAEGTPF